MSENTIVALDTMGFNPNNLAFYIKLDTAEGFLSYELTFSGQNAVVYLKGEDALKFQEWVQRNTLLVVG